MPCPDPASRQQRGRNCGLFAFLLRLAEPGLAQGKGLPVEIQFGLDAERLQEALRKQPAPDGMLVALLFPYAPQFGFELFELTLLPGYERLSEAHEPGVTEHVIVLRGSMEILVEGEWIDLGEGEAVRFAADRPHGYRNRNETPAVFHNLIHYAQTAGSGVLGDQPRI